MSKEDKFADVKFHPSIAVKAPKEEVTCTIHLHWIAARDKDKKIYIAFS